MRGNTEAVARVRKVRFTATLLDLLQGYARIRTKDEFRPYAMDREHVMTMEQALDRMRGLIAFSGEWADLSAFLPRAGTARRPAAARPRPRISRPPSSW